MRVTSLLFCHEVKPSPDGSLDAIGIRTQMAIPFFPFAGGVIATLTTLELEPDEADVEHDFGIAVQDPDMRFCGASEPLKFGPLPHPLPGVLPLLLVRDVKVRFPSQGIYPVGVLVDGETVAVFSLLVYQAQAQ